MPDKHILINPELHHEAKVEATKRDQSLKEFTEHALRAYLRELHMKTFVDTPATYSIDPRYDCNPNETD